MTRTYIHLLSWLAISTVEALTLPTPDGQYSTASFRMLLTDRSRQDPYTIAYGGSHFRQVVVSSFYPVALREDCIDYTTQYVPNATAAFYDQQLGTFGIPAETFASLRLTHCNARDRRGLKESAFSGCLVFSWTRQFAIDIERDGSGACQQRLHRDIR